MLPDEVILKIDYEKSQIEKELEILDLLLKKDQIKPLDEIEIRAATTGLHSIYNGIEKIIMIIFRGLTFTLPNSRNWHSKLLKISVSENIISESLHEKLRDLMAFRHFYRHAYGFMLDYKLLKPLIYSCRATYESFSVEISRLK